MSAVSHQADGQSAEITYRANERRRKASEVPVIKHGKEHPSVTSFSKICGMCVYWVTSLCVCACTESPVCVFGESPVCLYVFTESPARLCVYCHLCVCLLSHQYVCVLSPVWVYGVTNKCMCTESPVWVCTESPGRVGVLSYQCVFVCVFTESPASDGWPIMNFPEHRNKGSCSVTREEVIDQLKLTPRGLWYVELIRNKKNQ